MSVGETMVKTANSEGWSLIYFFFILWEENVTIIKRNGSLEVPLVFPFNVVLTHDEPFPARDLFSASYSVEVVFLDFSEIFFQCWDFEVWASTFTNKDFLRRLLPFDSETNRSTWWGLKACCIFSFHCLQPVVYRRFWGSRDSWMTHRSKNF